MSNFNYWKVAYYVKFQILEKIEIFVMIVDKEIDRFMKLLDLKKLKLKWMDLLDILFHRDNLQMNLKKRLLI